MPPPPDTHTHTFAFVHIEPDEHFGFCLLQFFKEANETYTKLQKEHESVRSKFTCNKNTPLENLVDLLKNLEVWKSGTKVFLCLKCITAHCCVLGIEEACRTEPKTKGEGCYMGQECGQWVRPFLPVIVYVSDTLVHSFGPSLAHLGPCHRVS